MNKRIFQMLEAQSEALTTLAEQVAQLAQLLKRVNEKVDAANISSEKPEPKAKPKAKK